MEVPAASHAAEVSKQLRLRRWNVGLLMVMFALYTAIRFGMLTMYPLAAKELVGSSYIKSMPVTLPLVLWYAADLVLILPSAHAMARFGRKLCFVVAAFGSALGVCLGLLALHVRSYWLLALSGACMAPLTITQLARFVAADVSEEAFRAQAIAVVVSGGALIGLIGPSGFSAAMTLAPEADPLRGYSIFLIVVLVLLGLYAIAAAMLRLPQPQAVAAAPPAEAGNVQEPRPAKRTLLRPGVLAAMADGLGPQLVMVAIMAAFPTAMTEMLPSLGIPEAGLTWHISVVMQLHILGMYLPSLLVGRMVDGWGPLPSMMQGWALVGGSLALGLMGDGLLYFYLCLLLLGIGWSCSFVASSRLLTLQLQHSQRSEKALAQGASEVVRAASSALASALASYVPYRALLAASAITLLASCLFSVVTYSLRQKHHSEAVMDSKQLQSEKSQADVDLEDPRPLEAHSPTKAASLREAAETALAAGATPEATTLGNAAAGAATAN